MLYIIFFFFQAEDGIRDSSTSRGLGDVYKRQDPSWEAARIRAMYTHPQWVRRGIGSLLIRLGEEAARAAGFTRIALGSTLAGEPLYLAHGYAEVRRETFRGENGADNLVITMEKNL